MTELYHQKNSKSRSVRVHVPRLVLTSSEQYQQTSVDGLQVIFNTILINVFIINPYYQFQLIAGCADGV